LLQKIDPEMFFVPHLRQVIKSCDEAVEPDFFRKSSLTFLRAVCVSFAAILKASSS